MNTTSSRRPTPTPVLAEVIGRHPFFAGMPSEHIKILAESAMFREFEPNEWICREGDPANRFYLICQGKAALEKKHGEETELIHYAGPGDELGWSWLFPPHNWHFDVRAVEPTSAIFFYGTWLRTKCEEDAAFGYELMKRVASAAIKSLQTTRLDIVTERKKAG